MAEVLRLPTTQRQWSSASALFAADERLSELIPGGEDLTAGGCFGDDVWDLAGHRAWRSKSGVQTSIKFSAFSDKWRAAAKEMILLQLNPALAPPRAPDNPMAAAWPNVQEPVAPVTAQSNAKMLSHALRIVDAYGIEEFDSNDWARLTVLLVQPLNTEEKRETSPTLSRTTGRGRAQQLITLWQVCRVGGREDLMGRATPFDGKPTSELFVKSRRNSVRPHENVGHLLGFCAWLIDHAAEDIVAHIEWWAAHTSDDPPLREVDLREDLLVRLEQIAAESAGRLPGSVNGAGNVTLAASALCRLHGVFDADLAYSAGRWATRHLSGDATFDTSMSPCPVPISSVPTADGERPWVDRLMADKASLDLWQRRLVYAAMYYLSATVMLRDSQLAELPLDCLTSEEITRPDGSSYVKHTLSAYRTKNRHAPVPTTVVVNGRVARLVTLLQRLHNALGHPRYLSPLTGQSVLFTQMLAVPHGMSPRTGARTTMHLDLTFVSVLVKAARELFDNRVLARHLDEVNLSMRQVRITCAQAYAVREHGQALAAAFGQWDSSAVATGYIGDVYEVITPIDPDETIDLAREDSGRRITAAKAARSDLTGAGLSRLDDALEAADAALSNPKPLTPARLRALGKNNQNITQGPLTLCVYQSEGAMCGGAGKPDFRLCLPGQCRNSVMSQADRARYELMRRQHLQLASPVLRRAADKMDDANPDIAVEFSDATDDDLKAIIAAHIDGYIAAALEDKA